MTASPKKLRNGSWGAITDGVPRSGDTITITTRGGKSWQALVGRVIWTGRGKSIVSTEPMRTRRSSGYAPEYCYHICPVGGFQCSPKNGPCHDCA